MGNKRKRGERSDLGNESSVPRWNFPTDYNDHFETPSLAYSDILYILKQYATSIGKTLSSLVIFDPYYCLGNMKSVLQSLGAPLVINENQDFYQMIESNQVPGTLLSQGDWIFKCYRI